MRLPTLLLPLLLLATSVPAAGPPTLAETLVESASLRDVEFVDAEHGWAVGDRGLVLRTTDGGQRWTLHAPPTDAHLEGVCFLDAKRGWAVGGSLQPYTRESRGLVLGTEDGGRNWQVFAKGDLPRLRSVVFFDTRHGVAVGDGTSLHPSGVYTTDDGGRHWRPTPGGETRRWQAGDFTRDRFGELAGVTAGLRGAAARVAGRRVDDSQSAGDLRGGWGVALVDPARGWLVGDGGLVRTTTDGGRSWVAPPVDPPYALDDWFDWRAVAARGERLWVVGAPGTLVLGTSDGGNSWGTAPTGISTPLTAIDFVDDQHGWAVGELGVILATDDGGQTWQTQRGAGRRAAAVIATTRPDGLPTELIAHTAAAEGYRVVTAAPWLPAGHTDADDQAGRLADAARLVAADASRFGWTLPVSPADAALPAEALRERLDRLTDARSAELLAAELQKLLLIYRPSVLAVPRPDGSGADLLAEAATAALARAAEHPPSETGLTAWQPERVIAYKADDGSPALAGESRLGTGEFSPLLGATPAQWRRGARGLLTADYRPAPPAHKWTRLVGRAGSTGSRASLLAGVRMTRGSEARRPVAATDVARLEQLRRLASKRRNAERLLASNAGDPAWAGQVMNLTGGLDAQAGAELLRQLAEGYREAGRLDMAADTLYLLARRYPEASLADASLLWLVRYYASGERNHADARGQGTSARPTTLANVPSDQAAVQLAPPNRPGVLGEEERLDRAAALLDFLRQSRPALYARPAVRMLDATTQRARGYGAEADKTALVLSKQAIAAGWRTAAETERWLAKPEGLPPEKPIVNCRYTPRRPKLDGQLGDPVWAAAEPIRLARDGAVDPTATARFAHDKAFLYLAIEAVTDAPQTIDQNAKRPRDADLAEHDRVRVRLDVDRDYATAFELTVDRRGWTHDSLWGDAHWRPTWYVAADSDAAHWRVEAAIPLSELTDPETIARDAWALEVRRTTPGQASAAWPVADAATDSPDAFGLLLFD